MDNRSGLAVYVTSHGFGHLNRTVAALNLVPAEIPITVRCRPDLFDGWRQRLTRPARLIAHVGEVGAINPPGDSAATDGPATLREAGIAYFDALGRVDEDAKALREEGTAAVLCDAPAVPLLAARKAGIPGLLLANFTWADIYGPHAREVGESAMELVASLRESYRCATTLLKAEPALPMLDVAETVEVGMVVTPGRDRRVELREMMGLNGSDKIVYFYVGRYGQAGLGWGGLSALKGVHFVGFHPCPAGPLPNFHVVPATGWNGADLAASADAIVAKAGYGTAVEAMAAGVPLIYPPREGFAEHEALERALTAWGGGVPMTLVDFNALHLGPYLDRAFALDPGPPPFPTDGARRVAEALVSACRPST